MTLVTGTVQDLGHDGMEGTLWARPARFRSDGQVVFAPERKPYKITGGVVSAELAPGPAVLELQVGSHARGTFEVVIPDTDISLADLLDTVFPWEPAQVSLFVAEREAAEQAKADAVQAATLAGTAKTGAELAAQQTAQDRTAVATDKDTVVAHVQALAEPNDAAVLGLISEGADTATKAALNATYASRDVESNVGFAPARRATGTPQASSEIVPIDSHDGWLYGYSGQKLHRTAEVGQPWQLVRDFATVSGGTVGGEFQMLLPLAGGEVLAVRHYALWRSTGFAANPATATWTMVLAAPSSAWFTTFNVDTDPGSGRVLATCYASPEPMTDSDNAWLSTDNGQTFTPVFSLNAQHSGITTKSHMHLAAIDPWAGGRLWLSYHDTSPSNTMQEVVYSDDDGATWTVVQTGMDTQPTVGIATRHGMVFGSDDNHNGLYRVLRTDNPADMVWEKMLTIQREPVFGWATRGVRDADGNVHVGFLSMTPGGDTYIASSDGFRADVTHTFPALTETDNPTVTRLASHNGQLVATLNHEAGGRVVHALDTPKRGIQPLSQVNSGNLFGGTVFGGLGVAVGAGSKTTDVQAVAVGARSSAGQLGVAVGFRANATAFYSVAIGHDAASGNNSIVVGRTAKAGTSCIALGYETSSMGAGGVAIGYRANSGTGVGATVVGNQASVSGTSATAFGAFAQSTGSGVAVGKSANSTSFGVALGENANAASLYSVALGSNVAATSAWQVAVGPRHMEMAEVAAEPSAPATNSARLFTRDNGAGKTQVCLKFATGPVQVLGTEA